MDNKPDEWIDMTKDLEKGYSEDLDEEEESETFEEEE